MRSRKSISVLLYLAEPGLARVTKEPFRAESARYRTPSDYIGVLIPYELLNSGTITFTLRPTRFSAHARLSSRRTVVPTTFARLSHFRVCTNLHTYVHV